VTDRLSWERDGQDWPNRQSSRFVDAGGLRWHVQVLGSGPVVVLVHGTGAATHSWRDLAPLLAQRCTVVAPDLPGHGFTQAPGGEQLSLPAMAQALGTLLEALALRPALAVGHSAGAAILARMCLDARIDPAGLVSLNGALLPLPGLHGQLFSPVAKLLAATSLAPRLFAWRARSPAVVDRLLGSTGSVLDTTGAALYARLARNSGQVAAALGMMANWDLRSLERELPGLQTQLLLVAGNQDRMISPGQALRVRRLLPAATVMRLPGLGHLAHEERPEEIAAIVLRFAEEQGALS
jgi:magnesium chelatase accessory protein